jgi:hypothetical protein
MSHTLISRFVVFFCQSRLALSLAFCVEELIVLCWNLSCIRHVCALMMLNKVERVDTLTRSLEIDLVLRVECQFRNRLPKQDINSVV